MLRSAVALVLALGIWVRTAASADTVDLVILHANDTHGCLLPFRSGKGENDPEIGGFARLATLVGRIRAEHPGRTLVCHAGDEFSRGGPLTVHSAGAADMQVMTNAGFEVFVPGNGEFYFGPDNLVQRTREAGFITVLANVRWKDSGERLFPEYHLFERSGVRIAVLGLGFIRANHHLAANLTLDDAVAVAREQVRALREQADLLIALTHIGHGADLRLAQQVPEIDIVIGGHSHTKVEQPKRVERANGTGAVVVTQAWDQTRTLGRLDVRLRQDGDGYVIERVEGCLIPVDESVAKDANVVALLQRQEEPLRAALGTWPQALTRDEALLLAVDAMRGRFGADVALLDDGAIRAGIPEGDVALGHVYRMHPWRNAILTASVTGRDLRKTLVKGKFAVSGGNIRRPQSGLDELRVGGELVDDARSYTLVAGDYLVSTTAVLRQLPFTETGERIDFMLREILAQVTQPAVRTR